VVASVYSADSVSLSVSPTDAFICEGTPLIFTANGGADLSSFQLMALKQANVRKQRVSNDCVEKGQIVKVRTRYAITFDGNVTETAWKGAMEDNIFPAFISECIQRIC
jgi:hypothetical protein